MESWLTIAGLQEAATFLSSSLCSGSCWPANILTWYECLIYQLDCRLRVIQPLHIEGDKCMCTNTIHHERKSIIWAKCTTGRVKNRDVSTSKVFVSWGDCLADEDLRGQTAHVCAMICTLTWSHYLYQQATCSTIWSKNKPLAELSHSWMAMGVA